MTKQASIASFFGAGGAKPSTKKKPTSTSNNKKDDDGKNDKKQQTKNTKDDDLVDTDDDDEAQSPAPITKTQTATRSKRNKVSIDTKVKANTQKRQKIILEDSSDEEMVMQDNDDDHDDDNNNEDDDSNEDDIDDNNYKEEDDNSSDEDDEIEIEKPLISLKKEKPAKSKSATKKNAFAMLKQAPATAKSSSSSKPNAASNAASLLSSTSELESNTSWKQSTPASYSTLCQTLSSIDAISSRLDIQKQLTNLFRLCLIKNPTDLLSLVYLSSNSVAAAYECVELGIGDSLLIKAIGEASGSQSKMIKLKYEKEGDLGSVAMSAKGKQRTLGFGIKPKPLMAKEVLGVFRQIATTTGSQSQKWKISKIKGLLVRVQDPIESKYIIRGLQGKLRIGLAQSSVLVSLAHAILLSGPIKESDNDNVNAFAKEEELSTNAKKKRDNDIDHAHASTKGEELSTDAKKESESDSDSSSDNDNGNDNASTKEEELSATTDAKNVKNEKLPLETRLEAAVNIVKKAYSEVSSFDAVMEALLRAPISQLNKECRLRPGMPVEPMLAKPTKSIQEVLKRLSGKRFTCEFKYDGERAQVHMDEEGVTKVFSRSLLDTSEKFPEVPLYVKEACENVKSFVLDTEVVAYNRETQQFVPFQVLSTRKKTEESEENAKVKVIVQAFDLMYLNGESLLDHTLSERRDLMKKHFKAVDGKFQFAKALDHTEDGDTAILEDFLETAVKGQCEGLMVKTLDENATYQPSYRSLNWLKLKKDYLDGMGDSVDLVPIGAYHGRGKRTGVYGAYLLACYDLDTEEYQSVCKIGTGFSDEDLKTLSKDLNEKIIKEKSSQYNVSSSLECDVWFDAAQVWEVKAADLSKSSTHKGAVDKTGEVGRGIGLRFPRFERIRDDKRPDQATSSDQILDMYYAQDSIVDGAGGYAGDGI